ncbi:uncharacterized protein LOC118429444 [Branchiostoma floridae]|uniref:Uncharacterized protein LOC118429444 n=1 Tax=Branchiostoma floridae TaxID=7739 RepID=A0A9J7N777_BRAFL|nr:uncharacterized protein LOC118429444 [Branchiostoma floridae]
MGKDKRGIYRGRCMRCTCSEYVVHPSPENHTCGYCECAPTQHEEISFSPAAAKGYHHQGKVPYRAYQTLSPHSGQLTDKPAARKEPVYNGRGPHSQERLYERKHGSQEQDSDPSHLHRIEHVAGGRSSKYYGKAVDAYSSQHTCVGNFEEVEPDLYSGEPPNSDSGHGTGMEPSTPTPTTKQFQNGSPYSSSMVYQNRNQLHGSPTSHGHRGYYGRPPGDFYGTKQYNDKYTGGSHVHQHHQPQPSARYLNQQRRSLYKQRPAVKQQHSDSAQHQGEHLANQQKSAILEQNQQYGGYVSHKLGNECGGSPSSPYLQERQRKQGEFMQDKSVPYQPSDTYDPQRHNTLSVHYQQLHRERSNGTQLHDSTLPNESHTSQNSGNTGSPSTHQKPVLQGESLTGSAQSYDSSQSYSPHISHTSPEGGKDIMAKMKHLHQKLRKLEEAQTSVKRELQNIITGVINLPVSEIEMKASMELLPVQANHSDNLVQLLPTWKEPLQMIPGGLVPEKKLMEAKLTLPSWQNPLILGTDVSRGKQIGSSLGIRPLHSIEQGLQPVAKPLVNYNSDTDGNNQSGVEDISRKDSREHDIGSSQGSILVESSEQDMQQVSKLEDNNSDSNGNKQSPPGQNQLDQHVDVSEDQQGSSNLEPRPLPNPKDSPQPCVKPSDTVSNKQSDENGGMVHVERSAAEGEFESTSKQTSENETESRQDDGSSLDSIPGHNSEQPVVKSLGNHLDTYELQSEQSVHDHLNLLTAKQPPQEDITGGVLKEEGSSLGSTSCPSSEQHTQQVTNLEDSNSDNNNTHGSLCVERKSMETEIESPDKQYPVDQELNMSGGQHTDSSPRSTPLPNTELSLQSMADTNVNDSGHVKENLIQTEVESPRESPVDLTEEGSRQHPVSAEGSTPSHDSDQSLQPVVQLKDGDSNSDVTTFMMTGSGVSDVSSLNVTDRHLTFVPNSSQGTKLQLPTSVSDSETEEYFSASGSEMEVDDDMHLLHAGVLQDKAVSHSEESITQDEPVSSSEVSRKQDEPVSSPEVSRKQDEPVSSLEVSRKQDEPVSSPEVSRKQDEPVSSLEVSRKQDEPVSSPEVSRKQDEPVSSPEVSKKQDEPVLSPEVSRKQDEPVSSSEGLTKQDEPVSSPEVSKKQGEPVSSPEVSRKQGEPVSSPEVSRKQDEPVSSSEGLTKQDEPVSSPEVSRKQDEPVSSSEVSKKQGEPVSSPEVSRKQDEHVSSSEGLTKQDEPVSSPEVSRKQDEPVSCSEVSRKQEVHEKKSEESKKTVASVSSSKESKVQNEPVSSSEVSWKNDDLASSSKASRKPDTSVLMSREKEAISSSEESKEQGEPVLSSAEPRKQEASGLSSGVLRNNDEPVSSSEVSKKRGASVSSPVVPSLMVSIEQDGKGTSAQAPRRQGTPVSTTDQSRGQSVSVSKAGGLEEKGVPVFNTKTARQSVSVYSSKTVNTLSSDCGRTHTRLKWKDQHDTFHPTVHGKNIKIGNNGTTARRDQCYTDGICFTKFPIKMECNIHLKIVESKKFRGSMRIGFTSNNPQDMSVESLPAHSYPEVQEGFWIKPLHDKLAQQGYVVTYMVDSSGDVFYSINGEEKGLFFSGVDVSCRLWAAVDIHGSTIAVQFANDQVVSDAVSRNIHEGDQVMLQVKTVETLQLLQEGHGGMQRDLEKVCSVLGSTFFILQAIGDPSTGVAIRIDDDEDVRVFYKKHNRVWCINPAALRKVGTADLSGIIREGDLVAIGNDLERIKQLQKDHGEWVETMERTLGKIGRVTKITHQGDLRLRVDGKTWTYNAKAVTKITMKKGVSGTSRHSVNCDKGLHYWKSGVAKVCTRCGECTANGADCNLRGSPFRSRGSPCGCREKTGGCADCGMCHSCAGETDDETDRKGSKMARLLRMLKKHVGEGDDSDEEEGHVIAVGDKVRVTTDAQTLPILQREGGLEWDEAMLQVIGMDGRATQVSAKSVTVHFPHHGRWSLVPGCLTKVCVRVKQRGGETYQKGELVRIITDRRQLKRIQSKHGGYSRDMAAALGKTGCVMRCKDGSVKVDVTGMSWWFNPAALSRAVLKGRESLDGLHIKDGDYVRVDVDAETFKTNQVCHGGYVDRMDKSVEDFGVVHHIDIDGDAVVYYPDGTRWCINAMSLGKVDPAECGQIDVSCVLEVADWVKVEADKDRIKRVQEKTDCIRWQVGYYKAAGKVGQVRTTYPFNDVIMVQIEGSGYPLNPKLLRRASPADLKEVLGSGDITNPGFTRGDLVKIAVDINKLRVLQDGHGGFVDKMDELLELVGSVSFIDRDGDVYVRFSIRRLCFNPYSLAKVTPEEDTFHVGDLVLIEPDQERFKDLQRPTKHGRYNEKMLPACGKVGRLLNVMDQDKVRVKVLGRNWVLNPQLVTRMGNPGLGTGDWKSAAICAPNKHDWSTGRCLVCVKCGECTHYGRLCPARDKPGRYPGSICGCGNGHAGCDDCGTCRSCAGEIQIHEDVESDGKDAHEMGWQGEAVEKLGVGECQPTSSEKAAAHKVISAVLKKMSQAVEQLKKSENKQSTDAASIKTTLENNLLSPFTKYVSSTHRKLMGDHLANIDATRVLLDQYLKCVPAEDIRERDEQTCLQLECLQLLRKLLVHGTNSSPEFCRTVGRSNLLATLLQDLSSFHKRTRDDTWPAIHSIVTILYNCARVPENQEYFASCNVVSVLTPYLRSKDEGIRITTLSCLAFIIEEENLHLIRLNVDMAELIVSLLKDAVGTPEHITTSLRGGNKYSALQVTTIISVLVRNDENKQILVAQGMVDLLIRLIQTGDDGEKEAALLCIRRLADSDVISGIIRRETKVKELLLQMRKDRKLSKVVRDAVTMTVDVLENGPPQETKGPTAAAGAGSISTIKVNDLLVETKTPLGGGGFGVVFRGYHRRWMMNVAVKKLYPLPKEQSLRVSEALIEEANFMRRAQNAYRFIVPLYGVCVDENLTALVMDYMENGSVWDLMSRVKHITWWALRWRILHETILGMNFLHSLDPQIIHHDLKSQNIMLDEDFHAKISDFGLSKYKHLASKSRGSEVCLAGTITHIPPENLVDIHLKAGEKFDVYSFGILIWETLTGQAPYENAHNSSHIRTAVINGQRPDKKAIPKVGPNELSFFTTLMEECWRTYPGERPQFRDLGERVHGVMQRTNVQIAEAIHAVRTALGKEKEQEVTQPFAADDGPDA